MALCSRKWWAPPSPASELVLRDRPVHTDIAKDLPLVPMDDVLVEQVLINLLENAVKYTPAGTTIGCPGLGGG